MSFFIPLAPAMGDATSPEGVFEALKDVAHSASESEKRRLFPTIRECYYLVSFLKLFYELSHAYKRGYENAKAHSTLSIEQMEELHGLIQEQRESKLAARRAMLMRNRELKSSRAPGTDEKDSTAEEGEPGVIDLLTGANSGPPNDSARGEEAVVDVSPGEEVRVSLEAFAAIDDEIEKFEQEMKEKYISRNARLEMFMRSESWDAAFADHACCSIMLQIFSLLLTFLSGRV